MTNWREYVRAHLPELDLPPEREAEIIEELAQQLEAAYETALAAGDDDEEARARAQAEVSDWDALARELTRIERPSATRLPERMRPRAERPALGADPGRGGVLTGLGADIRYALRGFRRSPGFTAVAVLTLALGIGATTAIFSAVNAVLLRPLPYPESDRLVQLFTLGSEPRRFAVSYPNLQDLRKLDRDFVGIAAYTTDRYNFSDGATPEEVEAAIASEQLFSLLGVAPALGRVFTADDMREQVAVLSHGLWASQYGSDPGVLGEAVTLDGRTFTVIGVMPAGFQFPNDEIRLWLPFGQAFAADPQVEFNRTYHVFNALARLTPGVSLQQVQADMNIVADRIAAAERERGDRRVQVRVRGGGAPGTGPARPGAGGVVETGFTIRHLRDQVIGNVRPALFVLFGTAGLVLLIACANTANLLVARATDRRKEIAVCRALGAGAWRIVRMVLTESVVLSVSAGLLGLGLSVWGQQALLAWWPGTLPRAPEVGMDGWVLGFTLGLSLLTGIAFGIVPALRASRHELEEALREDATTSTGGRQRRRIQNVLVAAEVALALVLLVGAGLLVRSFIGLTSVELGYETQGLLAARVRLTPSRYPTFPQQAEFYRAVANALERRPSVASVTLSRTLPLQGGLQIRFFDPSQIRPDDPEPFMARLSVVGPGYFGTTGIPIEQGRDFTDQDRAEAPEVVIVNRRLADRLWPGESPIGKSFPVGAPGVPSGSAEVIGVIGDIRYASLDAEPMPEQYVPYLQVEDVPEMWLVVRANGSPLALSTAVREAVRAVDSEQPIGELVSLEQLVHRSSAAQRFNTSVIALFAALALALALVGIYSITAYTVTQRTREMGLRMAIGAQAGDVVLLLLREHALLLVIGLAAGLGGAFAATRVLRTMLFGVSPTDAWTFGWAALFLAATALLATYVPTRRATRIDPVQALRYE